MFCPGNFDMGLELQFLKWLKEERFGRAGGRASQSGAVRLGGQKDDRNLKLLIHHLRRLDAIDVAVKPDIHEDQVRTVSTNRRKNVLPPADQIADVIAEGRQLIGEIGSNDRLVFHYQNRASARHGGFQRKGGHSAEGA